MVARADILAGRAVILVDIQDQTERGLRAIRSQVRLTALAIKDIGGDLFRGGIFGTLASALPVKSFMDFQDQMLFLQTKSQATEAQMASLEKVIRRLGMTTSFSSTEVAEAATMLAQASFKPEAIEASLEAVLDLGRGAKISLEESASLLANTIETFKLGASSAANVASKFIAASRLGTLDVIDLKESMKELSGTFFNLGISLDETLALITALSFSSLKATKAGTSLNTEFLNMVSNADKMKEFFNIDVADGAGNFRGIVPILTEMEVALTKLGNAERTAKVAEIFNIRGGRAESAIFIRSMKEVINTLNQIQGAGDEARISAIKLDSALGGVFRRGVSAFEELMIAVGSTSEGPLSKFGENLAAVFNDLSKLSLKNQQLTQNLLLIGPAALVAGAGLLGMTMILGKVAMLLTPLMMLNRVIFDIAANIVGLNIKLGSGLYKGVSGQLVKAGAAIRKNSFLNTELDTASRLKPVLAQLKTAYQSLNATPLVDKEKVEFVEILEKRSRSLLAPIKQLANIKFTPANFKLPILDSKLNPKLPIINPLFQFDYPKIADELDFGKIIDEVEKDAKKSMKFRSLADTIGDAITTAVKLVSDPGYIKSNPILGERIARAVADVIDSNSMPKNLAPKILKGVEESLKQVAEELPKTATKAKVTETISDALFDIDFRKTPLASLKLDDLFPQISKGKIGTGFLDSAFKPPKPVQAFGGKGAFAAKQVAIEAKQAASAVRKSGLMSVLSALGKTIGDIDFVDGIARIAKAFKGLGGVLRAIGAGAKAVGNGILSVNWLRVVISGTSSLLKTVRGIFTVLNGIRRVVFSFSGILTIIELLILFGDRLPGISTVLNSISAGLGNLFSGIGETLKNLGPSLGNAWDAIKLMFSGNIEGGIKGFKDSLVDAKNVITTGLTVAWKGFMLEVGPGIELMKQIGSSLLAGFQLAIDVISSFFGNLKDGVTILFKGDGTLFEEIKRSFGPEGMSTFFATIGGFLAEVAKTLNTVMNAVFNVLNLIKSAFISILQLLSGLSGETGRSAQAALDAADANSPVRKALKDELTFLQEELRANQDRNIVGLTYEKKQEAAAYRALVQSKIDQVMLELDQLGPAFGTFESNLSARNSEIDAALKRFLDSLQEAADRAANNGPSQIDQTNADKAAATAQGKADARTLIDSLGSPVGTVADILAAGVKTSMGEIGKFAGNDLSESIFESFKREATLADPEFQKALAKIDSENEGSFMERLDKAGMFKPAGSAKTAALALEQARLHTMMDEAGFDGVDTAPFLKDLGEGALGFLENVKGITAEDVGGLPGKLFDGVKSLFTGEEVKPGDIPEVAIASASLPQIGKAIVGGFGATRNKLQSIKSDKIAERALEAAEKTEEHTRKIAEREALFG